MDCACLRGVKRVASEKDISPVCPLPLLLVYSGRYHMILCDGPMLSGFSRTWLSWREIFLCVLGAIVMSG